MCPVGGLLLFLKTYTVRVLAGPSIVPWDEVADSDLDDEDEEDKEKVFNFINTSSVLLN